MSHSESDVLKLSAETINAFFENSDMGIYLSDFYTGEIIMCNSIYANAFGMTNDEMIGKLCYKNLGFDSRCPFCPYDKLLDNNGNPSGPYTWENYFDKFNIWLYITNRAIQWVDGRLAHMATYIDITKRREQEEKLNQLAFLDRVTQIPNAKCLDYDLGHESRLKHLIVLELQDLKEINDSFGWDIGNALLKSIRDFINDLNIPHSLLYRLEIGDFGILSNLETDEIILYAKKLCDRFENAWLINSGDENHAIFTACNICIVPTEIKSDSTMIRSMYNAIIHSLDISRKTGIISVYDDDVREKLHNEIKFESSLKKSVRDNMAGFSIVYQPIVESDASLWKGIEALCRWDSPEFGIVPPDKFIPIAESNGLINTIGMWVLEKSIIQVKDWNLHIIENFLLNVNISPAQLAVPGLDKLIINLLEKYNYPPEKLCLEITESSNLNFSNQPLEVFKSLDAYGVIIALDDFGTGYSSFNSLHKLPVKVLKTDKDFIAGMESDSYLQYLLYFLVDLAHSSNKKIVVEGVEKEDQAQFLLRQDADYFQGYLFSKPLSPAKMEENLHKFYVSSEFISPVKYSKIDLAKLSDINNGYELTPALYKILNKCMRELLTNNDTESAINLALKHIGECMNVSRAYVFLSDDDKTYSNLYEWCAPGVKPEKDILQHIQTPEQWDNALKCDGFIITSDIRCFDKKIYKNLNDQGIKALAIFPVWKNDELYGFVGFDDCEKIRKWTREEVQTLHTLTDIITCMLGRLWLEKELAIQNDLRNIILNNMDIATHVTDIKTNKILFVNSGLEKLYSGKKLKGRVCWEALENRSEPCEFCPFPNIPEDLGVSVKWDHYCEYIGRHLKVHACYIPWSGGKLARLEYAEDVTELKASQNKLELYATTDMLTSILNRHTLLDRMKILLDSAYKNSFPVTLVFIDIDCLKDINDTYGHSAGDEFIINVVNAVSENIRSTDILGRYGGDEFIVAVNGCEKSNVEKRMNNALLKLKKTSDKKGYCGLSSFSYGLVENKEVVFTTIDEYINQLINIADERMFEHKRHKNLEDRR